MEQTVSMILHLPIGIEYAANHHQQYMDMPQTITMTTLPCLFLGWFFEHRQTQDRAKVRLNHQRHYKMWRINGSTKYIKPAEDSTQVVPCQSPRKPQFFSFLHWLLNSEANNLIFHFGVEKRTLVTQIVCNGNFFRKCFPKWWELDLANDAARRSKQKKVQRD